MKFIKKIQLVCLGFGCALMVGCSDNSITSKVDAYKNLTSQQIFSKGKQAMTGHKYDDAIKYFEALNVLYPFESESKIGQLDVIYAYYANDDEESAIASADRYIHLYPSDDNTDYAYYLKGIVNMSRAKTWLQKFRPTDIEQRDLTYLREAFVDFNDLLHLFPDSAYAKDARQHMLYIRNLFAQYEFNVANYYFGREAYVAAANRASYIVKHYQGTPYVKDALQIMLRSYRALGVTKDAQEVAELIKLNP